MDQASPAAAPPPNRYSHIDEFAAFARNSNTHDDAQIELIAKMIATYGWTNPIAKHERFGMGAGHGRLAAARLIYSRGVMIGDRIVNRIHMADGGYILPEWFVPWIDVSHMSETDFRAFILLDNQVGRLSKNDPGLLHSEFELLKDDAPLLLDAFDDLKPIAADDGAAAALPDAGVVPDEFWITLSGPLEKQAKALQTLRQILGLWPDLKLDQGVTRHG